MLPVGGHHAYHEPTSNTQYHMMPPMGPRDKCLFSCLLLDSFFRKSAIFQQSYAAELSVQTIYYYATELKLLGERCNGTQAIHT
jgi:hypothetical protein